MIRSLPDGTSLRNIMGGWAHFEASSSRGGLTSKRPARPRRHLGMATLARPWRLMSPEGTLHVVADDEALLALAKTHGQRSSYFRNILGLQLTAAKGGTNNWRALHAVRRMQNVATGEYAVIAGRQCARRRPC